VSGPQPEPESPDQEGAGEQPGEGRVNVNQPAPTVVICGPFDPAGRASLEQAGLSVRAFPDFTPEAERAARGASALIVRSHTPVTAELMDRCPLLRAIGRPGSGTERVDTAGAEARGIAVVSAPGANAPTVAEHTLALILALTRRLAPLFEGLREGRWEKAGYEGSELAGRNLALIGLGRVGRAVALRARSFGVRLRAHDPWLEPDRAVAAGVELTGLEDLLREADIVSLHAPLTPETTGLLDTRRLALLPRGALVVNTARGALIDEAALLAALESGQVGGAALDVHAEEPPGATALLTHPRVIATPHVAGTGPRARAEAARIVAERLIEIVVP